MELKPGIEYIGTNTTFFCHDGNGNYVMIKRGANARDEQGTWEPGGGRIELHDSVVDTLKKEIAEEYCTDVLEFEFLGYRDVHRVHEGTPTHWIALDFKVLVDREKVRIGEPHKFDGMASTRNQPMSSPLHSQMNLCLEKYRDKLV